MTERSGVVKFNRRDRGFGFVIDADQHEFHEGEVFGNDPQKGDRVTFKLGLSRGKPVATNVRVI